MFMAFAPCDIMAVSKSIADMAANQRQAHHIDRLRARDRTQQRPRSSIRNRQMQKLRRWASPPPSSSSSSSSSSFSRSHMQEEKEQQRQQPMAPVAPSWRTSIQKRMHRISRSGGR
ncbi:hypothetical protein GX51_00263 [Blastomyces parvus]|uniref:Uncharacterized protein n=1 Tax=Blastomyces parvus TaxID=2060905 RepID=A0A2B7XN67_9EURO|nr:hypothetical protein GX51_00263 [Blastomyces parvus]